MSKLCDKAQTDDAKKLKTTIERSDTYRHLKHQIDELCTQLDEHCDGLSIEELQEECGKFASLDEVKAEEDRLNVAFDSFQASHQEKSELVTKLKYEAEQMLNEGRAAELEFEKEVAVAEMQQAIERYVPLKTSAIVLNWVIEHFQQQKQAPLLLRAGEIFSTLTLGRFSRLEVEIDKNNVSLFALRDN